jgi:hypothetical protein
MTADNARVLLNDRAGTIPDEASFCFGFRMPTVALEIQLYRCYCISVQYSIG